jgi:hypothetical protein
VVDGRDENWKRLRAGGWGTGQAFRSQEKRKGNNNNNTNGKTKRSRRKKRTTAERSAAWTDRDTGTTGEGARHRGRRRQGSQGVFVGLGRFGVAVQGRTAAGFALAGAADRSMASQGVYTTV